jgi:hypothetical protein
MPGKPKNSWGGARKGAGRKTKSISVRQLNAMLRKGRKWAKETGYDIDEFLLAVIAGDKNKIGASDIPLKERIACARIWKQFTMATVSEQNINVKHHPKPVVYLPAAKEDPALTVVNGGKGDSG